MKIWPLFVFPLLLVQLLSACTFPAGQPASPPATVADSPLIGNRWRLEQILVNGEQVSFTVAAPQYIEFGPTGYLETRGEGPCFSASSMLVRFTGAFFDEPTYQLIARTGAGVGCDGFGYDPIGAAICADEMNPGYSLEECNKVLEKQYYAPTYLHATNRYELTDDHLILRGEGIEMTYVIDNP